MFAGDIDLMIYGGLKRYSINKHLLKMLHGKTSEPKNTDILNFFTNSAKIIAACSKKSPQFSQYITI